MNNKISLLEKKIGINFKDKKLLIKSLTHKSFNSNNNYEKLEFLGDRVLGLIISKTLLEIFPEDKEGSLDKKLASLVNRKKCCEISKKLNLENFIVTGNARSKKNKIEDKIISDACEALIGAIYLDQGLSSAENVQRPQPESGSLQKIRVPMKLAFLFLIFFSWFYLRKKLRNTAGQRFPWIDWFLGIMICLYGLILLFMILGLEQRRAGLMSAGCVIAGVCFVLAWSRKRVKSKS